MLIKDYAELDAALELHECTLCTKLKGGGGVEGEESIHATSQSVSPSVSQSVSQSVNLSVSQSVKFISQSVGQSVSHSVSRDLSCWGSSILPIGEAAVLWSALKQNHIRL